MRARIAHFLGATGARAASRSQAAHRLLGILSVEAARSRRTRARRVDPKRLSERAVVDPADEEQQRDVVSAVTNALLTTPAPYRDVLQLHLLRQKTPAEIATELDRAPGTVRSQLMRGLELLRVALPSGLAGAALVANATRGHAALRERVLEAARASTVPASTSLTPIVWFAMLSLKTWIILGATTVALAAWLAWPPSSAGLEPRDPMHAVTPDGRVDLDTEPELAPAADAPERASSAPAAVESANERAPRAPRVVGVVQGLRPEDAADAEVVLTIEGRRDETRAHPDRTGRFEVDIAAHGSDESVSVPAQWLSWERVQLPPQESEDATRWLLAAASGDKQAADRLLPLVYAQLRKAAQRDLAGEIAGHTLSATALVHEAYLKLVGQREVPWANRGHFYAAAAEAMRRILIDHARARDRRGGQPLPLAEIEDVAALSMADSAQILAVDEAFERLESEDPEAAAVVRLRFYAGLSVDEAAKALGLSPRTAARMWTYARAVLYRDLSPDS